MTSPFRARKSWMRHKSAPQGHFLSETATIRVEVRDGNIMLPVVKQHWLPLVSDQNTPDGWDLLAMTVYIVCFYDDDTGICMALYLSVNRLLEAPSHISILAVLRTCVAIAVPIGVWVSIATLISGFIMVSIPVAVPMSISIPGLGALLDGVSPLSGGGSLTRSHPSHLVDLNLSLWRVLDMDVHQGRVERNWRKRKTKFVRYSG